MWRTPRQLVNFLDVSSSSFHIHSYSPFAFQCAHVHAWGRSATPRTVSHPRFTSWQSRTSRWVAFSRTGVSDTVPLSRISHSTPNCSAVQLPTDSSFALSAFYSKLASKRDQGTACACLHLGLIQHGVHHCRSRRRRCRRRRRRRQACIEPGRCCCCAFPTSHGSTGCR